MRSKVSDLKGGFSVKVNFRSILICLYVIDNLIREFVVCVFFIMNRLK